ncbi:MAG TPA: response regulator [Verrucomicrobiae bacterium]|nr:response regulator [Verrucomicrobiae bacterium]
MNKALVVDDSRAVRMILSKTLRELGFEVLQAANGVEALDVMARNGESVQLALVDWNMPEMNGIELVRRLRAQSRYDRLRLMMVTTETEIERITAALEAGANEYIMKPFSREVVEDKLRLLGVMT